MSSTSSSEAASMVDKREEMKNNHFYFSDFCNIMYRVFTWLKEK